MNRPALVTLSTLVFTLIAYMSLVQPARANDAEFDLDARTRAKLAKEKVRLSGKERELLRSGKAALDSSSDCGSQNIGNFNTNGRIGAAPREIFVFAPNAINLVSGAGCK
jgi:hypothetical protein